MFTVEKRGLKRIKPVSEDECYAMDFKLLNSDHLILSLFAKPWLSFKSSIDIKLSKQ